MRNDHQRLHCTVMQLLLLHDQFQNKDDITLKLNKSFNFAFLHHGLNSLLLHLHNDRQRLYCTVIQLLLLHE
jgi:hypothetical protein